jgi:hypothetical protein
MSQPIRVNDLPDRTPHGVALRCPSCGDQFSATRSDYFWMPPDRVFRCQHDRTPLQLTREIPRFEDWRRG